MRSGVWCREAGVLLVREDPVYLIRDLDLTEGDRSPGRVHDLTDKCRKGHSGRARSGMVEGG